MKYKIKISPVTFEAADDFDAVFRARGILETLKFTIYGQNNNPLARVGFAHAEPEELDFEFDSPEMDEIRNRSLNGLSWDLRDAIKLRCNAHDSEDLW